MRDNVEKRINVIFFPSLFPRTQPSYTDTHLNKDREDEDLRRYFDVAVVRVGRVGADDGAVLVVGEVGVVRLVVGVGRRGGTVLGRFRVAGSAEEVCSAGETATATAAASAAATAAADAVVTGTAASKGATSAPLWRWSRWLSCRVQP